MIVRPSIDWITMSEPVPKDPLSNGQIWPMVGPIIETLHGLGLHQREVSWRGYHGIACEGISYMQSDAWVYSDIPGDRAEDVFVAWVEAKQPTKITRLDLCVTVSGPEVGTWWGASALAQAHHPNDHIKRSLSSVGDPEGAYTIYVGSPSSDYRLTIYRKDLESPYEDWPTPSWRYEMRVRKPNSHVMAEKLARVAPDDRKAAIMSYLADKLFQRGIHVPWKDVPGPDIAVGQRRRSTSIDQTLSWIEQSVGPSVRKLLDAGYTRELLHALGIAASPIVARHVLLALKSLGHTLVDR